MSKFREPSGLVKCECDDVSYCPMHAAAPELVEALQQLSDTIWKAGYGCEDKSCTVCKRYKAAIEAAQTALRKAGALD